MKNVVPKKYPKGGAILKTASNSNISGYYGNWLIAFLNLKLLVQTIKSDFISGEDLVYKC